MEQPTPPPEVPTKESQKIQQNYAQLCTQAGDFYFKLKGLEYQMLSMQNAYTEALKKENQTPKDL